MRTFFIVKTTNNNYYLYSRNEQQLIIIHPIIASLFTKVDVEGYISELPVHVNIEPIGIVNREEVIYYYKKYKFLSQKYFKENFSFEKKHCINFTEQDIAYLFANCENVIFETTEVCNLNCTYCSYGEFYDWYSSRQNNTISFNKIQKFLDFFFSYSESNKNTSYKKDLRIGFYGGEPTLNFKVIEKTVNYINKSQITRSDISYSLTTNGTTLQKHSSFFKENNFSLLVSLDGNEIHNAYRIFHNGKGSYKDVMSNIEYIKEKYPNYFKEYIRFNSVLHNKNNRNEIKTFFSNNFGTSPGIVPISYDAVDENKKVEFLKVFQNEQEDNRPENFEDYTYIVPQDYLEILDKKSIERFLRTSIKSYKDYSDLYDNLKNDILGMTGTCSPFSFKIFITADGKILPCENVNHKFVLGQVSDNGVDIDFNAVSKLYSSYLMKMKSQCYNCYFQRECSQCLYYLDIDFDKPTCNGFTPNHKDYEKYLKSKISALEEHPENLYT